MDAKIPFFQKAKASYRAHKTGIFRFLRFSLSSMAAAGLEIVAFSGLNVLLNTYLSGFLLTALPTCLARILSCTTNFFVNRKLVFKSPTARFSAYRRFLSLAIPLALCQLLITHGIYTLFQIPAQSSLLRTGIYTLVMIGLFFINFFVQQHWVFRENANQK